MPQLLFITAFVMSNVVLCGVAKIENARMQRCIRYLTSRVPGSYPGLFFGKADVKYKLGYAFTARKTKTFCVLTKIAR
jgi:hypothetical protein